MKLVNSFSEHGAVETFLRKRGFWILIAFALGYYGYYYNVWPGPYGEGGLVAVIAQRLMEGQRPIVDTFLGYNVLWFYPVVAVFKLFGPNYIALRLFFFTLSLATGLMGWRLMFACTGRAWASVLVGILMIGLPGQMYRNYMAFLVVLNMATFLPAYVLPRRSVASRIGWMAVSGITLGIAYLTRVDLGFFLTFILLGLALIFPVMGAEIESVRKRLLLVLAGLLLGSAGLALMHLPVWLDAKKRGFSEEFVKQYAHWPRLIAFNASWMARNASNSCAEVLRGAIKKDAPQDNWVVQPTGKYPEASAQVSESSPVSRAKMTGASLGRPSWKDTNIREKIFFLNIYLPVPCSILIVMLGFWVWLSGLFSSDQKRATLGLCLLSSMACSLVLFPQYFWWRPDMVHLSEFMVPMIFTLVLSFVIALGLFKASGFWARAVTLLIGGGGVLTLMLYLNNGFQSGSSGGIAVSDHKTVMFHALNGVDVRMKPGEIEINKALFGIVTAASNHGEPVICYPYNPEINFMTDRPSYAYNLYADNDIPPDLFCAQETALLVKNNPPVIVINNWDINGTEESRFCNWAAPLRRRIASDYTLVHQSENFEVYVRPDRMSRLPQAFSQPTPKP